MFASTLVGTSLELLTCRALSERNVPHGFTLRSGGFGRRDRGEHDRETLKTALGLDRVAHMKQVHEKTVRFVNESCSLSECDALATKEPGLGVIVHAADCVPLLFWASRRNAVAAVHAGWRGTMLRVASETVAALGRELFCSPNELHVVIGPSIRVCCFEVGGEVVEAFAESGHDLSRIRRAGPRGRDQLDLVEDNRMQLAESGVPAGQVYDSERCTLCENDKFYSYRAEGKGVGRLMGVIAVS
jgi:YfiH family protein